MMRSAANFILVEGIGNGSGRLSNAIEDAEIRCCGIGLGHCSHRLFLRTTGHNQR